MSLIQGPVAVIAPCGAYHVERFEAGLAIARDRGLDLRPLPGLLQPKRYLAAPDTVRIEQLLHALTAPEFSAVWIARGGYGLTRILHALPDQLPRRAVIGFSDVTALLAALHPRGAGPLIHGPVVHSLSGTDAPSLDHLFALLSGEATAPLSGETWVEGSAEGWLAGGNLCLLAALCGTPWQLQAQGSILILEEIGEPAYKIDRMLQQLVSAGQFRGVKGVCLGEMVSCRVPEGAPWTLREVFLEHLAPLGIPLLAELPIGHGARNRAFPWGASASVHRGQLSWAPPIPST